VRPNGRWIRISHHLDTGQAEGSFEFDPKEWAFFTGFSEGFPSTLRLNERRKHLVKEGYHFGSFAVLGASGVIAVSPQGKGYFWTPEYD